MVARVPIPSVAIIDRATGLVTKDWYDFFVNLNIANLKNFADDTAAAAGGIAINGLYRTGSIVKIRVT
jgi:hypothetical protein